MSVIRLQWREPTHDWGILVREMEGVESTADVPVVCVTVAEADRLHMRNLGHDFLPGMFKCGNGVAIWRALGGLQTFLDQS